MIILLILLVFIISIFGGNLLKIIAFSALLFFIYNEHFSCQTVLPLCPKLIKEDVKYMFPPEYIVDTEYKNDMLDEKLVKKNLHTGQQAEIINKGLTRSRVDQLKPIFKEEQDYYENVEWWNEDRTQPTKF